VLGLLRFEHLLAIAFLVGVCSVFFHLAYQSYLPRLLARRDLVEGNGKVAAGASTAEIAGPGLGGLLVGAVTAPVAVVVDAVSFGVSAACLARIEREEPPPEPEARPAPLRRQVGEGSASRSAAGT
jgi:MFS family permease